MHEQVKRPVLTMLLATVGLMAIPLGANAQITVFEDRFERGNEPITLSISLAPVSAVPPDEVTVTGIPADLDVGTVFAEVTTADQVRYKALLDRLEDGSVVMITPLNADDPVNGGPVTVSVSNGSNITSNAVPLAIEALPPATVTMREIVTKLQTLTDRWLAVHGRTRETLRALDFGHMSTLDYPLFLAQDILDSPDNPNSLRATVNGPVPYFEDATLDFDLADRLLSRTGLADFLDEEAALLEGLSSGVSPASLAQGEQNFPANGQEAPAGRAGCIDQGRLGIDTPDELDANMKIARFATRRLDGASGKVVRDAGSAFSAIGVVPMAAAKGVSKVAGGGIYVYQLLNSAAASLLPSDFLNAATRFTPNPSELNEDAMLGFWDQFEVTAISAGWELDEDILNALFELANFDKAGGIEIFNDVVETEFGREISNYVFSNAVGSLISEVTQGGDVLQVCPGTWPNIDCTLPPWSKPTLPAGTSITLGPEHNAYRPKAVGASQLKVETDSRNFAGRLAFETRPIEVRQIQVSLSPDRVGAVTSEILSFKATVQNADDTRVKWIVPAGFTVVKQTEQRIFLQMPATPWETAILTARSLANKGLRKGKIDSDPREGLATIRYQEGEVIVRPPIACVAPNKQETFTAEVTAGVENDAVEWSREGAGSLTGNVYTAPGTAGLEATVIATSVERPSLQGTASVFVGECRCAWTATLTGDLSAAWSGDHAVWSAGQPGGGSTIQFSPGDSETFPLIAGALDRSIEPGATGTYEFFSMNVADGTAEGTYIAPTETTPAPTMVILSNDGVNIEGYITGVLAAGTVAEPRLVDLTLSFSAAEITSNGGSPCRVD